MNPLSFEHQPMNPLHSSTATQEFDVIIVGAGGAGSAAAYQLALRGQKVLLLEQFQVAHDRGSSHGHSRIFRFAYSEGDYVALARAALGEWRKLEAVSGLSLLTATGGLDLGPASSASLLAKEQALAAAGAEVVRLDAGALGQHFPQWRVPDDWLALYSPDAGILNPSQSVELLVALAQAHGASLLERCPVMGLDLADAAMPTVLTEQGRFAAPRLILAAGAWVGPLLGPLLPQLAQNMNVSEEATVFFRSSQPELFDPERFPIFIGHNIMPDQFGSEPYGFPNFGLPGLKLGWHHGGATVSAERRHFTVAPGYIEKLERFVNAYLPQAAGPIMQTKTCLYSNTANSDFILDELPTQPNVLLASPCSGHGFKFMPMIGVLLADWAEGKPNPLHAERFRLRQHGI
jgi:sarcosine oxidase